MRAPEYGLMAGSIHRHGRMKKYVQEAKRRGLSCGVDEAPTTQIASSTTQIDFSGWSNSKLLSLACVDAYGAGGWSSDAKWRDHKLEGQRRGLYCDGWSFTNLELCKMLESNNVNHASNIKLALKQRNFLCEEQSTFDNSANALIAF